MGLKQLLRCPAIGRRTALVAGVLTLAILAAAATPGLLRSHVGDAFSALGEANRAWLVASVGAFIASIVCSAAAWRSALCSLGGSMAPTRAAACYGTGCLVNTFVPARLGDAVRIGLFSYALPGRDRVWQTGGVFAAIGAARCLALAVLLVAGSAAGQMSIWPAIALGCGVAVAAAVSYAVRGRSAGNRLAHLLDAFREFGRSPVEAARVTGWLFAATAARVAAAATVAAALGLHSPLRAALVIVPALDAAGLVPLTPGNIGVTSGAIAMALQTQGVSLSAGLTAGIAFHAVETVVGVSFGLASVFALATVPPTVRRWVIRVGVAGACCGLAAALGVMVLDLV